MRSMSICVLHIQRITLIQVCIQWLRNIPRRTTGKRKATKKRLGNNPVEKKGVIVIIGHWIEKRQRTETVVWNQNISLMWYAVAQLVSHWWFSFIPSVILPLWELCVTGAVKGNEAQQAAHSSVGEQKQKQATFSKQGSILNPESPQHLFCDVNKNRHGHDVEAEQRHLCICVSRLHNSDTTDVVWIPLFGISRW